MGNPSPSQNACPKLNEIDHNCAHIMCIIMSPLNNCFWGAEGAPILFSEIGFCVASCSYIYTSILKISIKISKDLGMSEKA